MELGREERRRTTGKDAPQTLAVGGLAPGGQAILAVAGWESMTDDELDLVAPLATSYMSCLALTVAGFVSTIALLAIGGLWLGVVAQNRIPNPNAVGAAVAAVPITVALTVALLQPSVVTAGIAWSALRSRPSPSSELAVARSSATAMRF